jgi:iron-sulfur cluster repair protein YtfE (RIC family)
MKLTRFGALAELVAQHDALRSIMARCEQLADEVDASVGDPIILVREIERLREAFAAHNIYEEQILRPVLLAEDRFGAVRVDRMIEDHKNEHAEMRVRLGSAVTADLRDVIETLRAHLEAEERYLLSSQVLRDDVAPLAGH